MTMGNHRWFWPSDPSSPLFLESADSSAESCVENFQQQTMGFLAFTSARSCSHAWLVKNPGPKCGCVFSIVDTDSELKQDLPHGVAGLVARGAGVVLTWIEGNSITEQLEERNITTVQRFTTHGYASFLFRNSCSGAFGYSEQVHSFSGAQFGSRTVMCEDHFATVLGPKTILHPCLEDHWLVTRVSLPICVFLQK